MIVLLCRIIGAMRRHKLGCDLDAGDCPKHSWGFLDVKSVRTALRVHRPNVTSRTVGLCSILCAISICLWTLGRHRGCFERNPDNLAVGSSCWRRASGRLLVIRIACLSCERLTLEALMLSFAPTLPLPRRLGHRGCFKLSVRMLWGPS